MCVRALVSVLCAGVLACAGLGWPGTAAAAQSQPSRTVLAVFWSPEEFPANQVRDAAIREVLLSPRSHLPVDYFAEYLESDRFPPEEASLSLRDYIRRKYRNRRIDVVLAITDVALQFVLRYRGDLFPDAPVVYFGAMTADASTRLTGAGLTGVVSGRGFRETVDLALRLHPGTQRVFVVARWPDFSLDSVQAELRPVATQASFSYISEDSVPGLLRAIEAVPPRSLILYIRHSQDALDAASTDIARLVAARSKVPVYVVGEGFIGSGVVGGSVYATRLAGNRMAEIAIEILEGRRAQDIPIEPAMLVPTFDWRQVQRWGIDPSRLPPGSDIRFRTPTAWESYREYILGAVIVIAAQLVLIAGLLTQRARRRRAEETIRTREATLRTSYERIRHLAGRLIHAQEAARADIARDLHDDVCQELVGVSIAVSSLRRSSGHIQDADTQQALSKLEHSALGVVEGVRRLSHDLHPATLRLLGLAAALKAHCLEVEKRHDVQVSFKTRQDLGHLHPEVAVCLFRIAQEALRNGAVHGEARRLGVSLVRFGDHVELTVTDDGRGFDLEAVRRDGGGLGLVSMEERAHVVGGNMHIATRPGHGTTIRVRVSAGAAVSGEKDDVRVHLRIVGRRLSSNPTEPL